MIVWSSLNGMSLQSSFLYSSWPIPISKLEVTTIEEVPSSYRMSHLVPWIELISRYLVLVMGFYFAPNRGQGDVEVPEGLVPTLGHTLTKLWAWFFFYLMLLPSCVCVFWFVINSVSLSVTFVYIIFVEWWHSCLSIYLLEPDWTTFLQFYTTAVPIGKYGVPLEAIISLYTCFAASGEREIV